MNHPFPHAFCNKKLYITYSFGKYDHKHAFCTFVLTMLTDVFFLVQVMVIDHLDRLQKRMLKHLGQANTINFSFIT